VDVTDVAHESCDVVSGGTLASATAGPAKILWAAKNAQTTKTGEQWCLVLLGGSGSSDKVLDGLLLETLPAATYSALDLGRLKCGRADGIVYGAPTDKVVAGVTPLTDPDYEPIPELVTIRNPKTTAVNVTENKCRPVQFVKRGSEYEILTIDCTEQVLPSPFIDAGPDRTITEVEGDAPEFTLNGRAFNYHTDSPPITYEWTRESGPGSVTITDETELVATVAAGLAIGTHVFRLTADNGVVASVYDEVTITIEAE
jgi:hypothetical protein